jgi:RNA polymerase sigma factor (sigma-70 family)
MKSKLNDSDLIKQYCDGNDQMIGILYVQYHSLFMATSRKYFCDIACAEDVVQDVLLKFLSYRIEKRVELFSNIRSIKAFIYTAVRNMALDRIRKKKLILTDLSDINLPEEDSQNYNNIIVDYNNVGLSPKESIYFNDYINDISLDEISRRNGVKKNSVKNTIQNAKKKIIAFYQNHRSVD